MILKARAANGSSSEDFLSASVPSSRTPLMCGISSGDGIKSTISSSNSWTPLFLYEDPQVTGTKVLAIVDFLIAALISSSVNSSPPRYFSINSSSIPAKCSSSSVLYFLASSIMSAGISSSLTSLPNSS